ncbi:MAG: hypothetical protein JWL91_2342 [Sphingomonas bacterium]|nr:FecR domain-containing protein [Sphingomonas bacterium]MDB5690466.1 hypothetical protein [Sphingomonas bacterium]
MSARSDMDERLVDEAVAWQQALERDDADWAGYVAWLEADPRHREAFDEIALLGRIIDERADDLRTIALPSAAADPPARVDRRRWRIGSLAAAAAAIAVGVPALWPAPADTIYSTGPGVTRQIALGNGASVDLAPSSRLVASAGDTTRLQLARGEAYFDVTHDPARTLLVQAGNYSVTDIGTKFGINLAPEFVTVTVAEGHVSVKPDVGGSTRVAAGQQLLARRNSADERILKVAAADVGSWRRGRLVYNQVPLSAVAADLERYSGKTVTVNPGIRDLQFSGVLTVGDGSRLFDNLSDLMSITYESEGSHVRLVASPAR